MIPPAPDLIRLGVEDEYLVLTPEDFMEFYLDADNDEFGNIQVSSLRDDVSLGYVHSNVEQGVLGPLSNDDIASLLQ